MLTDLKDSGGVLGEINPFRIFGMQPWLLVYRTWFFAAFDCCTPVHVEVDLLNVTLVCEDD